MRENETFTITVKNGLYIGDLCYVLDDSVYYGVWGDKHNYKNGAYTDPATGLQFAMVNTAYGDGEYSDDEGHYYPVDAGIIGICDLNLCTADDPTAYGQVINCSGEVSISYDQGFIEIDLGEGDTIVIPTTDYDDEDEEDDFFAFR